MGGMKVMVNGLPGNMASKVLEHAARDARFDVIPQSLTGPEITDAEYATEAFAVKLIRPEAREEAVTGVLSAHGPFISVDFTHPSAVNDNADFYCRREIPFVMGTTGGDRAALEQRVRESAISAVIAPNMAKQIVGFQAMMEWAASAFPNLFEGYRLEISESHQKGKADTSGTAKAMVAYFNRLGPAFSEADIQKERDPEAQRRMGVPEAYLGGHGWHAYTLTSGDDTVTFGFTHNVNGRDIYAKGTLDALIFLSRKMAENRKGTVFSMIDVLKGA